MRQALSLFESWWDEAFDEPSERKAEEKAFLKRVKKIRKKRKKLDSTDLNTDKKVLIRLEYEEELQRVFITESLLQAVQQLSQSPTSFLQTIVDIPSIPPMKWTPLIQEHAFLLLEEAPEFQHVRYLLSPSQLSEDAFWSHYTQLVTVKNIAALVEPCLLCSDNVHMDLPLHANQEPRVGYRRTSIETSTRGWRDIRIPTLEDEARKELRYLMLRGVPDAKRTRAWQSVMGVFPLLRKDPQRYADALHRVYHGLVPEEFTHAPCFGAPRLPSEREHALSVSGNMVAMRLLQVLAMEHVDIRFAPSLPTLVYLLLGYMSESACFIVMERILQGPDTHCPLGYILLSTQDLGRCCTSLMCTIEKKIPLLHERCMKSGFELPIETWLLYFGVGWMPLRWVVRLIDWWMLDGLLALVRSFFAILYLFQEDIPYIEGEALESVLSSYMNQFDDERRWIKASMGKGRKVGVYGKKGRSKSVVDVQEEKYYFPIFYRPHITTPSLILRDADYELVWSWLPPRYRILDPVVSFSTSRDGISLAHVQRHCQQSHPTLLVLSCGSIAVGVFCSLAFPSPGPRYFGNGLCFVFSLRPEMQKFEWTRANDHFLYSGLDGHVSLLSIGSGPCLSFRDTLETVVSHPCTTYGSPGFFGSGEEVNIDCMEVITFQ